MSIFVQCGLKISRNWSGCIVNVLGDVKDDETESPES